MGIFNKKTKEQLAGIVKVTFPDGVVPSVTPSKAKPLTTGRPGGSNGSNGGSKTGGTPTSTQQPYSWLDNYVEQNKPRTKEQEDADRRRAERNERLARIGDVMTAMHQAYSHARGVQPMPSSGNLSEKTRARYEKLEADRRARDQWWVNAMLNEQRIRNTRDIARMNAENRANANAGVNSERERLYKERADDAAAKNKMREDAERMIQTGESEFFTTREQAEEYLKTSKAPRYSVSGVYDNKGNVRVRTNITTTNKDAANESIEGHDHARLHTTPPSSSRGSGGSGHSKGHSTNSTNRGSSGSKGKGNGYSTNSTHSNNRGY